MKITYGNHSPFDSDSCLEWGLFCQNTGNDPNHPITIETNNKGSILLEDQSLLIQTIKSQSHDNDNKQ